MEKLIMTDEKKFAQTAAKIDSLSPMKTLLRGYTSATKDGKAVTSVKCLEKGDKITLRLLDGRAECLVEKTEKE